jgi:hypothetical protein
VCARFRGISFENANIGIAKCNVERGTYMRIANESRLIGLAWPLQ